MQNPVPVGRALSDRRMGDLGLRRPSSKRFEGMRKRAPATCHHRISRSVIWRRIRLLTTCVIFWHPKDHMFLQGLAYGAYVARSRPRTSQNKTCAVMRSQQGKCVQIRPFSLLPSPRGCDKRLQILPALMAEVLVALVSIDL